MNARTPADRLFLLGMILSMTCWGLSWASGKILSAYGDPLTISFLRFALTFVTLPFVIMMLKVKFLISKKGLTDLVIASLLMSLYTWLFFKGLTVGRAGAGGVLVTVLNPIIAYAIMLTLSRRKPSGKETIGLVVGLLAGMILLKLFTEARQIFDTGNVYFLLAAFFWAVLSNFTARASRYGSPVAFSFWIYAISTVIMFLFSGLEATTAIILKADFAFWGNMFFVSTIVAGLATTFYFVATSKIGASRASSFIFMVPFSAALGSWIFLGEKIQGHTIIGGLLGIVAVYILNRKESASVVDLKK
jgi:drug/metabolite transporter (DMT)-like permease